ncbi:hypothetical protein M0804_001399 [Polistes exclamans]|nr:hypothetical protein M0804_001399 [Polistes exclamans]
MGGREKGYVASERLAATAAAPLVAAFGGWRFGSNLAYAIREYVEMICVANVLQLTLWVHTTSETRHSLVFHSPCRLAAIT